jgi:hypothetical protein
MTPKDKAIELVDRYSELGIGHPTSLLLAKQCALIAVDEMIGYLEKDGFSTQIEYWQEVKQEIEKL